MSKAGSAFMAKKEKTTPDQWKSKPLAVQVRGSAEWKAWVEKLAAFDRGTVADVADRAMAAYARMIGFGEPPPER